MAGFTKLFNSILHSTIWTEPNETRILWITLLAMSDKFGCVNASIPGLSRMAGITLEETEKGLKRFQEPDPYSRTPEFEGRRIEPIEGGWKLLNHGKYRALMSAEERREYNRLKQKEYRQKKSANVKQCQSRSMTVSNVSTLPEADTEAKKIPSAHAEFVGKWEKAYSEHFGESYAFQGGKDAKAVKQLLLTSGKPPDDLIRMAKAAWNNTGGFYCKSAGSLSGFNSKFNDIRSELNAKKNATNIKSSTESGRGLGTANEGKSSQYAGVGKIKPIQNAQ